VVATTVAGTLATSFANGQTVDGVTLVTGDRILIKNQATGSENGIYTVNVSGAPTRAADCDTGAEIEDAVLWVTKGTANADTQWKLVTD
jgi:phage-related tail fiber protein